MGLISKAGSSSSSFEPVPVGTHIARCVTVVDMGFQDSPWGPKEKVYIAWEVPGVRVSWTKDDKEHEGPAIIGNTYTNSIHPDSNLGMALVSWRNKVFSEDEKAGFDLFNVLDVPCMISVIHNTKGEKTYANISAIMGVPRGTVVPARETPLLAYTPQDNEKAANYDKLPQWLKDKCDAGHRSQGLGQRGYSGDDSENPNPNGDYDDDLSDVPF